MSHYTFMRSNILGLLDASKPLVTISNAIASDTPKIASTACSTAMLEHYTKGIKVFARYQALIKEQLVNIERIRYALSVANNAGQLTDAQACELDHYLATDVKVLKECLVVVTEASDKLMMALPANSTFLA